MYLSLFELAHVHVVCKTAVYMFSEQMSLHYVHVCKTPFAVKDC